MFRTVESVVCTWTEDRLHVPGRMKDANDLQRLRLPPIDNQVRKDRMEAVSLVGQVLAVMPDAGVQRQSVDCLLDLVQNPVGRSDTVGGDVFPDLVEILLGTGCEN